MNKSKLVLAMYVLLFSMNCDSNTVEIDYFGQTLPGNTPAVFAPGLISSEEFQENGCCFSPDGTEFYFSRVTGNDINLYVSYFKNDNWSEPELFFESEANDFEPYITHDNKRLYYTRSNHSDSTFQSGIWYLERNEIEWSGPYHLKKGMFVSSTVNGELYYSGMLPNGWISGEIEMMAQRDGLFTEAVEISGDVNSDAYELHPCVSHDGTFLIFVSRRTDGRNADEAYNDLYISFKQDSNLWGKAHYLGGMLGKSIKMSPYLSPDGKHLFYTSNKDIYWVSSTVIDKFKNK